MASVIKLTTKNDRNGNARKAFIVIKGSLPVALSSGPDAQQSDLPSEYAYYPAMHIVVSPKELKEQVSFAQCYLTSLKSITVRS